MIEDRLNIQINASPHAVFNLIDRMPNKFPIYDFFETKPILFLRLLLVDGLESARAAMKVDRDIEELHLGIGDPMGPFTLIDRESPSTYCFSLKSLFFNCRTGYFLTDQDGRTCLNFDLISENPTLREKVWWFVFKPMHRFFGKKVLSVIKEKAELN